MNRVSDGRYKRAVVCLFCGLHTPVSGRSADYGGVSIVRCERCCKEAPYPAAKIVDWQDTPNIGPLRARAAGFRQ